MFVLILWFKIPCDRNHHHQPHVILPPRSRSSPPGSPAWWRLPGAGRASRRWRGGATPWPRRWCQTVSGSSTGYLTPWISDLRTKHFQSNTVNKICFCDKLQNRPMPPDCLRLLTNQLAHNLLLGCYKPWPIQPKH